MLETWGVSVISSGEIPLIRDTVPSAASRGAVVTDACGLLTAAEVQGVVGSAVTKTESFKDTPGQPGCTWTIGDGTDNVSIQVRSPGGRADFTSARSFIGSFDSGLASAMPTLASDAGNLFQQTDLTGLGDGAFIGPGNVLYVMKGDTELRVQPAFLDSDLNGKLVKLARLALGRI